jgi:hypothetical protein
VVRNAADLDDAAAIEIAEITQSPSGSSNNAETQIAG